MNKSQTQKVIVNKLNNWLISITDDDLRNDVSNNLLLSGGAIASLLLGEDVNDYDIYIQDLDVLRRLSEYYLKPELVFTRKKAQEEIRSQEIASFDEAEEAVFLRSIHRDQVKLKVGGEGLFFKAATKEKHKRYSKLFISENAITLSEDIQIITRFTGDHTEIHKNFDFIHATNYFTFKEGLVLNQAALESLLAKQLHYQGSKYPITSIIRTRKFIQRGWTIHAGDYLKMAYQCSFLDLENPDILEEQLIGIDIALFAEVIAHLKAQQQNNDLNFFDIIDMVFNS